LHAGFSGFLPGQLDGARGEIHTAYLPACIGQGDNICTSAASEVDGAAGFVVLDEVKEFWWADACIPRRLPEVPVMEKEAAEQILHFLINIRQRLESSKEKAG